MKIFFDFLPVAIFFLLFKLKDIYVATYAIMIITPIIVAVQVALARLKNNKIEKLPIVAAVLLIVFGGATIFFQDENFIKLKVTVVNFLFALVFLVSHLLLKKNLVKLAMQGFINLEDKHWSALNFLWIFHFLTAGVVNLYVANNFSVDTWVNFKLFGLLSWTIFCLFLQFTYLFIFCRDSLRTDIKKAANKK